MQKNERLAFIKMTEKLVTPKKVATVFQASEMLRKLPQRVQKKIMSNGSKKEPYMSFIVEPYSLFLAYEIIDESKINDQLPEDYELVESAMFDETSKRKCVIIGAFNVHTSVFWGNRVEIYIIAKHKRTGLTSWLIQEYETNTISYDPGRGFIPPDTEHSVLTTSFLGELILDVAGKSSKNKIQVNANIRNGVWKSLNQTLWIDGNLSVDYGANLTDFQTKPFGLIFDPEEMKEAFYVEFDDYKVIQNTFLSGVIDKKPFEVCCFPYAQHFYTTTMPMEHNIKDKVDLENRIIEINRETFNLKDVDRVDSGCAGYCYSYSCKNGCRLKE